MLNLITNIKLNIDIKFNISLLFSVGRGVASAQSDKKYLNLIL